MYGYAFGPLFHCFVEMDGLLCSDGMRWMVVMCHLGFSLGCGRFGSLGCHFFGLLAVCTLHTDSQAGPLYDCRGLLAG
jgi:hypothetical protein